jgi:hypothetical protein
VPDGPVLQRRVPEAGLDDGRAQGDMRHIRK